MSILYIVRGLPGSGKSTFAKTFNCLHVEADNFHMVDGEYNWKPENVSKAHKWCTDMVINAMSVGMDVAVSNTFTQKWELDKYLELAKINRYEIKIFRCTRDYGNVHSVPEEALKKMAERFEDIEGEELI